MDVRIQSIHFDASEQLQAFIQKKVSKLEKYYEDIKKVEVSLKVIKPEVAENKEAGIKILIPNGEFYASKVCDTFEEAIDLDVEAHVGVAVAVLYADNHVADNGHAGPVARKFLVCGLCIVLLRLNELVVEVNVILPALLQLPCGQQAIQEQCVERVCRIEVIGLS